MALLTPCELATRLDISERTIRDDMEHGMPFLRVPPVLIPEREAIEWRRANVRRRAKSIRTLVVEG